MHTFSRNTARSTTTLVAMALVASSCVRQPTPAPVPQVASNTSSKATSSKDTTARKDSASSGKRSSSSGPKPYKQVITKKAKTQTGLFTTHMIGNKLYFEIPASEFGKDMLMVGRYAAAAAAPNPRSQRTYGGDKFAEETLRWERRGNRVYLKTPSYRITADTSLAVSQAVAASNMAPIIASFEVLTYGKDSAAVIDVTPLYMGTNEYSAVRGRPDDKRSYIESVATFPENIEVRGLQTGGASSSSQSRSASSSGPTTVLAHWSMVKLPEQPLRPRLADDRIGYFTASHVDFGTSEYRAATKTYIKRWRLEKKDTTAELSEPVEPIVYYVDPATPDWLKPYIHRAIESWQPAFEAAGFKNAIIAKDPPTDDPTWHLEDVRNTVIRWLPSTTENAQGPHVADPRTGEILNGSIRMFHNILNLQRSWYFTQAAAVDPRARTWPMPDSLMGRLIQYVVAHEIGHTLGLTHNHKASSTYPMDSVRSASWVSTMGHTPSIMSYSRFNYVAQPEDNIPVQYLIPNIGPYDKFAIMWGYKPIPGTYRPEDELGQLNTWARMQDTIPWLRFSRMTETGQYGNPDYGDQREAVGNADAVRATELGIRNLKRIAPMLIPTTVRPGEDYSDLREIYGRLVGQWAQELTHVVDIVGGAETQIKYGGQAGVLFTPLPREQQRRALLFLNENAFKTPTYLVDPNVTRLLEPTGSITRIGNAQNRVLSALLNGNRLTRLVEFHALAANKSTVYSPGEFARDLRQGIWSELSAGRVTIDAYRRNLQRHFISQYGKIIDPPPPPANNPLAALLNRSGPPAPGDFVAIARAELITLRGQISAAIGKAGNTLSRAHLIDARERIDEILEPEE